MEHTERLRVTFDVDVSADQQSIYPQNFCNGHYAVCSRKEAAVAKGVTYKHVVKVFEWTEHTAEGLHGKYYFQCGSNS